MSMIIEIRNPLNDVNDTVCELLSWIVDDGEYVTPEDELCEIACSKAVIIVVAEQEGYLRIAAYEGDEVAPGELLGTLHDRPCKVQNNRPPRKKDCEANSPLFTNGAEALIEQHGLDRTLFADHPDIVRERHVLKLIEARIKFSNPPEQRTGKGVMNESLSEKLASDNSFVEQPSSVKIEFYRQHGAVIGNDVVLGRGSVLIGSEIVIGDNVTIAPDCRIEADVLRLGTNVSIGLKADWFAHAIVVGRGSRFADKTRIDVAGGLSRASTCRIGEQCLLCMETYLNACRPVQLGDRSCLSPRAMIFTHSYWHNVLEGGNSRFAPVSIKKGAWVGAGAQVMPGVTIGEGATLASNSLADSSIPDLALGIGVPAQVVRTRNTKSGPSRSVYQRMIEFLALRLDYLGRAPKVNGSGILTGKAHWFFGENKANQCSRTIVVAEGAAPESMPDEWSWIDLVTLRGSGLNDEDTALTYDMLRRFGISIFNYKKCKCND